MRETTAIAVTLVVYKIALLAIGLAANRRTRDTTDFFLGGRQLGPVVAALSASASSSSAWTLMGVSGAAYLWGVSAVWLLPACVGGFLLNWYVLAPRLRAYSHRTGALTVTDVLAGPRHEPGARWVARTASAIVLISLLAYVASQFHGAGKTFAETFEMDLVTAVLLGSGIIIVYTLLGGFWAVSVTDALQGLVMAGASIAVPIAAFGAVGGWGGMMAGVAASPVEGFGSLTRNMTTAGGVGFVAGLLGIGLGYPGQPHVVNRFMALRDGPSVVVGRRVAMAWALVIYVGMIVVGLCARVLFPDLADHELALLHSTTHLFSPTAAGIIVAAVLSAIMSTADSQLLVAASSVSHDLRASDDAQVGLGQSRRVVLGLSAAAVVVALVGSEDIFNRVLFAWAAMGAAFGPLLLVTIFRGRVPPKGALASMLVGFGTSVAAYLWAPPGARGVLERVVPCVLAGAVAWIASRRDSR